MKKFFPVLKYVNIPNLITSLSLCLGIITFLLFTQKNYKFGIVLYMLTLLLDGVDGYAARRFHAETDFGAEIDNLADAINFTVIPALIAYFMGFDNAVAVLILLLYIISGVWRLVNYSLAGLTMVGSRSYFTGLCTTHAGALFLLSTAIYLITSNGGQLYFMYPFFAGTALLMNLNFKYDKNGWFSKSLFVLIPAAVIVFIFKI